MSEWRADGGWGNLDNLFVPINRNEKKLLQYAQITMFNTKFLPQHVESPQGLPRFTPVTPHSCQVPSVTASVATLPEAFRPTAFRTALHGPETWRLVSCGRLLFFFFSERNSTVSC